MIRLSPAFAALLVALVFVAAGQDAAAPRSNPAETVPLDPEFLRSWWTTWHDFDAADSRSPMALSTYGQGPGPTIEAGVLTLLHGENSEQNVVAFPCSAEGAYSWIDAFFELRCTPGADGMGFALLSTQTYGADGAGPELPEWEEPNLPGSFAVGFDLYNPPTKTPFDANGNVYRRPEREVSLHWDGVEVANALSPVEFRDGEFHPVRVSVRFVTGGSLVSVWIDDAAVYKDHFIADMHPYESRVALGARTGGVSTELAVDNLFARYLERDAQDNRPAPLVVPVFEGEIIHAGNRSPTAEVELAPADFSAGRIILVITLEAPPGGFDGWDRSAAVYVWGDDGERYEIARYITPFGRGYTWKADVTDYQSLLRGRRKMGLFIDTWVGGDTPETRKGWKVSADLRYTPGTPKRVAFEVRNLWSGQPEYGNPDRPLAAFFEPRKVSVPADATGAKLRFTVTGHGQNPNTKNAAEFMPADRTVTVNGKSFENRLWRTDSYLNPCRPQGGTWKYDRAGWAPGALVRPWDIDISGLITPGKDLAVTYTPMEYVNENRDKSRATHWVEAQLFLYR